MMTDLTEVWSSPVMRHSELLSTSTRRQSVSCDIRDKGARDKSSTKYKLWLAIVSSPTEIKSLSDFWSGSNKYSPPWRFNRSMSHKTFHIFIVLNSFWTCGITLRFVNRILYGIMSMVKGEKYKRIGEFCNLVILTT